MTRRVVTVTDDVSVAEAAHLMLQHEIACLPVLSEGGTLVGIVTYKDLLRHLKGEAPALTDSDRTPVEAASEAESLPRLRDLIRRLEHELLHGEVSEADRERYRRKLLELRHLERKRRDPSVAKSQPLRAILARVAAKATLHGRTCGPGIQTS